MRRHRFAPTLDAGDRQGQVASVSKSAKTAKRCDVEVRVNAVAQHVAGLANGARTKARAGPVSDAAVPRNASHSKSFGAGGNRRFQKGVVGQDGK